MKLEKVSKEVAGGCDERGNRCSVAIIMTMVSALLVVMVSGCSPEDEDLLERVRHLNGQGRFEDSGAILVDAIEDGRKDPETLLAYGMTLTGMNRISRAYWPLSAAMEDPRFLRVAAMQLAANALKGRNFEIAIRTMDRILEVEPQLVPALAMRGDAFLRSRRDYEAALEDFERILELEPDQAYALKSKAVALLGLDRPEEALVVIEEATRLALERSPEGSALNSKDRAFWCIVAASYAQGSGDLDEAKELYGDCVQRFPSDPQVVAESVKFFKAMGESGRTQEILRAAVEASPGNRQARIALVMDLDGRGKDDEALQLLRDATASKKPQAAANAWQDLAGFLKDKGDLDGAIAAFEEVKNHVARPSPELLFSIAETLILTQRYDEALAIIDESPVEVHRLMVAGRVSLERGDDERALEAFTRVVTLWPDNAPARYYAGLAAERLGDFDRAIEEYRHTIRSNQSMMEGRQRLARLHMSEGDDGAALAILRQSAPRQGRGLDAESRLLEFELLGRLGRSLAGISGIPFESDESREVVEARSLVAFASGIRVGPASSAGTIHFLLPLVGDSPQPAYGAPFRILVEELIRAERVDEALRLAKRAVEEHPEVADFQLCLALVEIARAREDEPGRVALTRALELDPVLVPALNVIAGLELALGRSEAARAYFERALEQDPDDGPAARGLVESLIALGRLEKAEKLLEKLLRLHRPFDGELALRLAELREGRADPDVDRTLALAQRAQRFGAKERAADLMARLAGPT